MSVEVIRMTGAELKKVWKRAGLNEEHLKERLDISKSSWYDMVNKKANEPIPDHIEARVSKDQDLIKWINLELSGPPQNQVVMVEKALNIYEKMAGAMQRTLDTIEKVIASQAALLEKQEGKYDNLARNNAAVLDMLDAAKKEGEFHYTKRSA